MESEYVNFIKEETDFDREADLYSLEHYGVPGMKWGIRKSRVYKPRHSGKRKKKIKVNPIRSDRFSAYKQRRTLSDEELSNRIRRLELEKRFKDLSASDLYPGRALVKDILAYAGPQAAKVMTSGAILYSGKVAMTKQFNWKEAADYITPKPKKK